MAGKQSITAEQLFWMRKPDRCELIAGEVRELRLVGYVHGCIAAKLCFLLSAHVWKWSPGVVCPGGTGFVLTRDPDTVRAPDVAFVRNERVMEDVPGYFPGAPDLAAEVVSPEDRIQEIEQ